MQLTDINWALLGKDKQSDSALILPQRVQIYAS